MRIGKDLRLVLPVETTKGQSYLYAQAVGREVFDQFFVVIDRAFKDIFVSGGAQWTGPRTAKKYVERVANAMSAAARPGERTIADDVAEGFFGEIRRLANVAVMGPNGWEMVPFAEVVAREAMDEEDLDEAENALVFFTLNSLMLRRVERAAILTDAMKLWNGRLTSLSFTEFVASLPTSTATASSGEKAPA